PAAKSWSRRRGLIRTIPVSEVPGARPLRLSGLRVPLHGIESGIESRLRQRMELAMASVRTTSMGFVAAMAVVTVFTFSPLIRAQNAPQSETKQSGAKSQGASKNQQAAPGHIYPEPV